MYIALTYLSSRSVMRGSIITLTIVIPIYYVVPDQASSLYNSKPPKLQQADTRLVDRIYRRRLYCILDRDQGTRRIWAYGTVL